MKWWGKLKNFLAGGFMMKSYLVIVGDYEEILKFEISKFVPEERHYEEIKLFMAKNYPHRDYIITFFTKNIRIN